MMNNAEPSIHAMKGSGKGIAALDLAQREGVHLELAIVHGEGAAFQAVPELARRAGQATSPAKVAAARVNGAKGEAVSQ